MADGRLQGTSDRKIIEKDCEHFFREKYNMVKTERMLKELEKDFAKKMESDFLTKVRDGK